MNCTPTTPLHCNTTTPLRFTELSTVHRHYSTDTALQPHCSIEFNCTSSTTLRPNYSTTLRLLYCTSTTPLRFIERIAVHRHYFTDTALQPHSSTEFHWTASTTLHHHYSTEFHCTASTTLEPYYSTALNPHCIAPATALHLPRCTPLLHCTVLTILQHHYSTVFHCSPHYSTALHCSVQCTAPHFTSVAFFDIVLYCMVQCYTRHCVSLHFTNTALQCTLQYYTLHCISLHVAVLRPVITLQQHGTPLHLHARCSALHYILHPIILYFTSLHYLPSEGAHMHLMRVSLESFVGQTTYRWSDFTLSINKEVQNWWTRKKLATSDRSLPH